MKNNKIIRFIFTFPVIVYSIFLIFLPLVYIFIISFFESDSYGGMIKNFTLNNYRELFNSVYIGIFLKSFLIALITTFFCIIISYPFVLAISRKNKRIQKILITLVMVPFLTNSLIRMYGFIVLLRKYGVINQVLMNLGIIHDPINLMYNNFGILIGMIYTLLPFMILPLYSSVSAIDKSLIQ